MWVVPLIWIGLLAYLNLSICLSTVFRTAVIEVRIKPTEFHSVPSKASKTLATAYGEIGSDPAMDEVLSMRKPLKCAKHL